MRFSLSVENVQADAGRDGQTRLARPRDQVLGCKRGQGSIHFPAQLSNLTCLIYTMLNVMANTMELYIHNLVLLIVTGVAFSDFTFMRLSFPTPINTTGLLVGIIVDMCYTTLLSTRFVVS